MKDKNLHKGHRDRLRCRFIETKFKGFQEHEILELLLFYAIPRVNTNETAHRLLERFGSLNSVFDASIDDLKTVVGISENSALFIKFIRDLCRYYSLEINLKNKSKVDNEFLLNQLKNVDTEVYLIISIDKNNNVLEIFTLPSECFSKNKINPRDLAEMMLKNQIHNIIVVHNHINRPAIPDNYDYIAIKFISECLSPLSIKISDYMIYSDGNVFSMLEQGAFGFSHDSYESNF